ncbi:hypothetical protein B1H19_01580 [Streptomyces gilvosporeus]|uniref:Uncharacterized protein n=1 Tax=Streptomyces gilvosporeus TaxID=553510 RepID=A0A1V0U1S1_9ACTN|nr:hypothetical protein B1H19_01580 [Streptomyces gilvosporeus]
MSLKVSGEHVRQAVAHCIGVLRDVPAARWHSRAGGLEWTCWETVEHIADDLLTYAMRFGVARTMEVSRVPLLVSQARENGPANVIFADRTSGSDGLLTVMEACGGLLATVVDSADPTALAPHVFGPSDPEGFAAMGVVETLVHTYDVTHDLDRSWEPAQGLSERVLARLFPDVAVIDDPWSTLLWATGRIETTDRARRTNWRWHGEPLGGG